MSISQVKAVIDGQTYPVALDSDGYYTLDSNAPALSSIHQPGGYYNVQITLTDDAGNTMTLDAADDTFGSDLRLPVKEITKPTVAITYPSNDSRINTCTPTITAQLRDNDSGVDPATLDLRINGGSVPDILRMIYEDIRLKAQDAEAYPEIAEKFADCADVLEEDVPASPSYAELAAANQILMGGETI